MLGGRFAQDWEEFMKVTIKIIFWLLIGLLLASCDGETVTTIYIQDLLDLIDNEANVVYTTATITAGGITDESEKDFLRSVLTNVTNEKTVTYNFSDTYQFDISVPILGPTAGIENVKETDAIYLRINKVENNFNVSYHINESTMSKINSWVYDNYYQKFDIGGYSFKFDINNDSKDTFAFTVYSVYMNDMAYPFGINISLNRRDHVEIAVSEVLNKSIVKQNSQIPFMSIKK